jgi:hypothetical protein
VGDDTVAWGPPCWGEREVRGRGRAGVQRATEEGPHGGRRAVRWATADGDGRRHGAGKAARLHGDERRLRCGIVLVLY